MRIPLPSSDYRPLPGGFDITVRHSDYASRCATWQRSVSYGVNGQRLQPEISIYRKLPKEFAMRLDPGISIGGAVVDERGKPLAGVRVLLSTYEYYLLFIGRLFCNYPELTASDKAKPAAVTDSRGRWSCAHFPSDLEPVKITFVRPDESSESFATVEGIFDHRTLVPFDKLADRTALFRLGNGVTVRGRVVDEKGKPLGNVLVKDGYGSGRVYRASQVKTARDGRFAFYHRTPRQWIYTASAEGRATISLVAQVQPGMPEIRLVMPPGEYLISRNYTVHMNASDIPGHQMPVVVKPGETVKLDYHGDGRAVIGRLIADPTNAMVDWLRDAHVLTLKERNQPAINKDDFVTPTAYSEARSLVTPERLQRIRETRNYELICQRDGSFHIDDVPPGTYELRIKAGVSSSFTAGDQAEKIDGPALRFMAREVIIPPGKAPLNLGAIVVPTILPWQ